MPHTWPLREPIVQRFPSAGLATLYSPQVPEGAHWKIEHVSFEGSLATSGGNTRARVYVDTTAGPLPYVEQISPVADTLYWEDLPITLFQGERLALEWDQAQAVTTLKLNIHGIAYSVAPPPPPPEPSSA